MKMTTAENIIELRDGGFEAQAIQMCESQSVSIEIHDDVEKTYFFADGSWVTRATFDDLDAIWSL
jgi:hypothetical protein